MVGDLGVTMTEGAIDAALRYPDRMITYMVAISRQLTPDQVAYVLELDPPLSRELLKYVFKFQYHGILPPEKSADIEDELL